MIKRNSYSPVENVKQKICPIDFYHKELFLELRKGKSDWKKAGVCPFHADKKVGSFFVNTVTGSFKCFSCGSGGGDIIAFTQQKYSLSFLNALQKIIKEWRIA